jgi:WD40 repeat protein
MMRRTASVLLVACLAVTALVPASGAPQQDKPAPPAGLPEGALLRIGRPRLRHNGAAVISAAFSPDGKLLASVGNDNLIRLWDPATGKEVRQLKGHTGGVQAVVFSADGKRLLTGSHDQTLRLWDTSTGKEIRSFAGHNGIVLSVALSADGKLAASESHDQTVRLWDVNTGKELHQFPGHLSQGTSNVVFSPDAKTLATMNANGAIRLWDVEARKELRQLEGHTGDCNSLDFSADGKLLASAGSDKTVRVWNVADGKQLHNFEGHTDQVATVRFTPDGKSVVSGSIDRSIRVWDLGTGKEVRRFQGHRGIVSEIAVSPDGKIVASAGHDGTLRLWDLATGKELPQSGGGAEALALAPEGKTLAAGGDDGGIRFWDLATGKELPRTLKGEAPVLALAYSPDGGRLAVAGLDVPVTVWDLAAGKVVAECAVEKTQRTVAVVFTADGKSVIEQTLNGAFGGIRVYDAATGKDRERTFAGLDPDNGITMLSLALSPGGRLLAATTNPPVSGRLWDTATGREIRRLQGEDAFSCICFSGDGGSVAAGGILGPVRLWETATGKERRVFQAPADIPDGTPVIGRGAVAMSPAGRLLASAGADNTVRIWDVVSGKEIHQYRGHDGPVNSLAFAPDGKTLISGGVDGTAIVWDLAVVDKKLPPSKVKLAAAELETAWTDLGSDDAGKAFLAGWALTFSPEQAVDVIRKHVPKPAAVNERRIPDLIVQLDDDDFDVREKATKELLNLGPVVEAPLRETIAKAPSAEVKRRAELILEKLKGGPSTPEALRLPRALEVLGRINTPEARKVAEALRAAK